MRSTCLVLPLFALTIACGKPSDDGRGDGSTSQTTSDESGSASMSGDGDGDGDGAPGDGDGSMGDGDGSMGDGDGTPGDGDGDGIKFDFGVPDIPEPVLVPVKDLPNLVSITFYERTGGAAPDPFTFIVDGPELTVRLDDPLAINNFDIDGASGEFYDVYYSDENGVFQLDGSYLTISGTFAQTLPAGGGLNLAEIGLNFSDQTVEYGNYVASFVALGDNAAPQNVDNAIDGDLQTHTTMGNTVGQMERLRVTLGFESSSGPQG